MKCPNCNQIIYIYEKKCPFCGCELKKENNVERPITEDDKIIMEYEKYFSWVLKIPTILSIFFSVLIFIEGIIFAFIINPIYFLLWLLIPIAQLIYFLQKMYMAPTVLLIKYLKKQNSIINNEKSNSDVT